MPSVKSVIPLERAPTLFKSAKAFEVWLKKNHAASGGLWLRIAKRGANEPSVTYPEAVEVALCWGWIDGQKKSLDDQHYLQRFTPRRARSVWSKINVEKVQALIEAGRMQPAGQAQIDAAKADGRWERATMGRVRRRSLKICKRRWRQSLQPRPFLQPSMPPIATRYCGVSRQPPRPRHVPGASSSWWRCLPAVRPSISSNPVPRPDGATRVRPCFGH